MLHIYDEVKFWYIINRPNLVQQVIKHILFEYQVWLSSMEFKIINLPSDLA